MRRVGFWRKVTSSLAGLGLLALGALPPEHVHDEVGPGGQHELVHRHLAAHASDPSSATVDHDDHDGAEPRWLSNAFTITDWAGRVDPPDSGVAVGDALLAVPVAARVRGIVAVRPSAHDPPDLGSIRPRAPPLQLSA